MNNEVILLLCVEELGNILAQWKTRQFLKIDYPQAALLQGPFMFKYTCNLPVSN